MVFDLRKSLAKAVAQVVYGMLEEILDGLEDDKLRSEIIEELRREDFNFDLEKELLDLLQDKNVT